MLRVQSHFHMSEMRPFFSSSFLLSFGESLRLENIEEKDGHITSSSLLNLKCIVILRVTSTR